MKRFIITRVLPDGAKRYDALWRANGKQRQKGFKRKHDAETCLTDTVRKVHDNTYRDVKPTLMGEVFDRWLEFSLDVRVEEGSLKPSTAKSYRSMVREHLRPAFSEYRSDRLTVEAIEAWRASVATKIEEEKLASKTYTKPRNLLHAILEWARHRNPAYLV